MSFPVRKIQTQSETEPLSGSELIDIVRLIRSENVGPVTFFHLLSYYGTAAKALEAIPHLARRGGAKRQIQICPRIVAESEIEKTLLYGARLSVFGDALYPKLLMQIHDPPPVLAAFGDEAIWQGKPLVAIVGARNASANGCTYARTLARQLGEAGYTVVSGLARGIDTFAHQGSLATGTVGVIAGGIDSVYPPENASLFAQLRERGGILSENPFGTEPLSRTFPSRNRIIAGMSQGIIVVEAARKSGSLITAHFALENGRDVFAVPGSPLDPRASGGNHLIKQGASIVTCVDDILEGLRRTGGMHLAERRTGLFSSAPPERPDDDMLDYARRLFEEKLSHEPVAIDTLIEQTALPPAFIQTVLLEQEIAGQIRRHPGGKISRITGDIL